MRKLVLAIAALALLGSAPADAADLRAKPAYKAPPVIAPYSWAGFYGGVHLGGVWGDYDINTIAPPLSYSFSADGFVGGVQLGYNWQWNQVVLGVEVDVSYKNFSGNDAGFAGARDSISGNWGGTLRARLGYAADRWLLYVTGGLAWMDYDYTSFITPAGPGVTFSDSDVGWTIGLGVEYAFAGRWSAKLEYLYADYGNNNRAAAIFATPWTTELTTNEVRFGINYRF
jgi:outer membrane immunogenic protein